MKAVQEEQSVFVNQSNEIMTLKKLLEAEAEKTAVKQKVEWEEKYDKMRKIVNEWSDKFNKHRETDSPIIQQLENYVKEKNAKLAKWRPKVVESVGRLKILHDICPENLMLCKLNMKPSFLLFLAKMKTMPKEGSEEVGVVDEQVVADAEQ